MKVIGIIAVTLAVMFVRSELLGYRRYRTSLREDFYRLAVHIRREIGCFLRTPTEIAVNFESAALMKCGFLERARSCGDFFCALNECDAARFLSPEEMSALKDMFASLGKGYMQDEIKLVDDACQRLSLLLAKGRESDERELKLVNTVCASLTFGFVVLII